MDEISAPAPSTTTPARGLSDPLFARARDAPDSTALSRKVGGDWTDVSVAEFRDEVLATAKGLVAAKINPGDRVALLSANRYEWALLDYALWTVGAVPVPIYDSAPPEQIRAILEDSGAVACLVETEDHEHDVTEAKPELAETGRLWTIDRGEITDLAELDAEIPDTELERRRAAVDPEQPATIVYTSGTTGDPKGCVLTHANLTAEIDAALAALRPLLDTPDDAPRPSTLLFLPLAHIFGRIVQIAAIQGGIRLGHASDVRTLTGDLAAFQPTFLLAVPRFLEKIHAAARDRAGTGLGAALFARAEDTAVDYARALEEGGADTLLRLRHSLFDALVYRRLRDRLGGHLAHVVSGGGRLDTRLVHFYRGAGIEVLEGYGLTETAAAVTVNTPGRVRAGTVGEPLPGVSVRIAEDGEVLVRGPQVFAGYHRNKQATREAMVDGWFATGDLGEILDGRLRITGRKKEVLITAGGKNVEPRAKEDRIAQHPLISHGMLVGDGRPFIAALITLEPQAFEKWKAEHGKDPEAGPKDLAGDPELTAAVQEAIDQANESAARAEAVRDFAILPEDFTVRDGTLTPTLEPRRGHVQERYREEIERLYAG